MLPSELPPPSPRQQSSSSADMESLLLRRSYLQDQANAPPRSRWLSLAPVEHSAMPAPAIAPPTTLLTDRSPSPATSFMTPHRPTDFHRERSATVSTDATALGLSPAGRSGFGGGHAMPALPGEDASSSPPPELVRSYPNSALSTDSEELLDDEARVDAEAAAAMYGQGDSMHDEDEEPAFRLSSPDIHGGSGSDFSQLRQTIGAMSQEAKEQEADDMRAHHIYKLHLARLEEAHWGST